MKIPVLTYHAINIISNCYAENDHIALATDLQTIAGLGYKVIPLAEVVDWHQGLLSDEDVAGSVAISIDDGAWFDYFDLDHPTCGMQRSMFNIARDFNKRELLDWKAHITSFVISSPQARALLDESVMIGKDWWGDQWWQAAADSGIMDVECHSWDHVHIKLPQVAQQDQIKGDFSQVKSFADCDIQFRQAGEYMATVLAGQRPSLFAYPYGQHSDYVVEQYLPENIEDHRFRCAFNTDPRAVSRQDSIWRLPRFVCGRDWSAAEELRGILQATEPVS